VATILMIFLRTTNQTSCSLNSKGKSGPGAEPWWGSGGEAPEAGEKIMPEMLRNSILT